MADMTVTTPLGVRYLLRDGVLSLVTDETVKNTKTQRLITYLRYGDDIETGIRYLSEITGMTAVQIRSVGLDPPTTTITHHS